MSGNGSCKQIAATTRNAATYLVTWGRRIPLEGRFQGPRFVNWSGVLDHTPERIERPEHEDDLRRIVTAPAPVRLVGAGHSFNLGFAGATIVSLDRYEGVEVDKAAGTARVKAGTRMRDLNRRLRKEGCALAALPSHDAQSIGGLLATDVHGTGKALDAFVSEQVTSLRIMDGNGDCHDVGPTDDRFRAAIGGVGATGVVTEATFSIVPAFDMSQRTELRDLAEVRRELPELQAAHDHLSLYVFPFAHRCQVNTWDRTDAGRTRSGTVREAISISKDAVATSVAGNVLAYRGWLPRFADRSLRIKKGSDIVLRSYQAFNRSVYHQHEELEVAVAAEAGFDALDELVARYEAAYRQARLPFTVFEVRFTPAGHDRTLIGPARDRATVWLDVVPNETRGFERFYQEVIAFARANDARPHLGKWADGLAAADLAATHGAHFERFLELRRTADPARRFDNPFTARLFDT